jgi:hypothetical protein
MPKNPNPDAKDALQRLIDTSDSVLRQAILLRTELAELRAAQLIGESAEDSGPTKVSLHASGRRLAFDPSRDNISGQPVRVSANRLLLPGLSANFEDSVAVIANARWTLYVADNAPPREAFTVSISDPSDTRWLTLEFLFDAKTVKHLGLVSVSLTLACAPAVRVRSVLRVFTEDGQSIDLPGLSGVFDADATTYVDGFIIPTKHRESINVEVPIRYIIFFPILAFDVSIIEAVTFPAEEASARKDTRSAAHNGRALSPGLD